MIEEGRHARPKPGTTGAAFRRAHPSSCPSRLKRTRPKCPRAERSRPCARLLQSASGSPRAGETLGSLRAPMESAFDADFAGVRRRRDSRADDLHARAVTRGEYIHLGSGEDPVGPGGRELVAHEFAHVVQQRNAPARWMIRRSRAEPTPGPPRAVSGHLIPEKHLPWPSCNASSIRRRRSRNIAILRRRSLGGPSTVARRSRASSAAEAGFGALRDHDSSGRPISP